jgi:hypothetical protein
VKSEVQQKYLDKLNAQEDEVGKLEHEKDTLNQQKEAKEEELKRMIAELNF